MTFIWKTHFCRDICGYVQFSKYKLRHHLFCRFWKSIYAMNWVCFPHIHMLKPWSSRLGGLRDESFGIYLCHQGGAPMNRISTLITKDKRDMISSEPCETIARSHLSISQGLGFHQALNLLAPWFWTSQQTKEWKMNACSLSHSVYSVCYCSWSEDTYTNKFYCE